MVDRLDAKAYDLAPLKVGDAVRVQNQTGNSKNRWDRTGVVREINPDYDLYLVQMDGSRRTTARDRKFLRKILAGRPERTTTKAGDVGRLWHGTGLRRPGPEYMPRQTPGSPATRQPGRQAVPDVAASPVPDTLQPAGSVTRSPDHPERTRLWRPPVSYTHLTLPTKA